MQIKSDFFKDSVFEVPAYPRYRAKKLINLANNELHHLRIQALQEEALRELSGEACAAYPNWGGFADRVGREFNIAGSQVIITAGSDDAYKLLTKALSSTTVIITQHPNYSLLFTYARLHDILVKSTPYCLQQGFAIEDLIELQENELLPAVVWISNPNGPTGSTFTKPEVIALAEATAKKGNLLVIDEAYVNFSDYDHLFLLRHYSHVIIIRSFSKGFGMAGMRLNAIVASESTVDYLARWNMSSSVSATAIAVAEKLFNNLDAVTAVWEEIKQTREQLQNSITQMIPEIMPLPSKGNFIPLMCQDSSRANEIFDQLEEGGFSIRAMNKMGGSDKCLRVTISERFVMEQFFDSLIAATRC
jgi:histidinol-phosphate aminotransferase